jgi:hypothetical protein
MLAYTRYVLDAGMRGDLLALKVALAPCVIGYAEIATRLALRPDAHAATNPYRVWIAEYAGAPYQGVAATARAHLEGLACQIAFNCDPTFASNYGPASVHNGRAETGGAEPRIAEHSRSWRAASGEREAMRGS